MRAVGYGLPGWLDTRRYLSADETRALGSLHINRPDSDWGSGRCAICAEWRSLQRAHIVRVGTSGRRKRGTDGPIVGTCHACHAWLDSHQAEACYAVRRGDKRVVLLFADGTEKILEGG